MSFRAGPSAHVRAAAPQNIFLAALIFSTYFAALGHAALAGLAPLEHVAGAAVVGGEAELRVAVELADHARQVEAAGAHVEAGVERA